MKEKTFRNIFYYKNYYIDFFEKLKDKDQLVILVNGFQKKSQKTIKKEIELAEKLRKEYFNEKENK